MEYQGSFKDLDSVIIKSTYKIEVNGKTIEPGEVIAEFDRIQIAGLQEDKAYVSANGGYKNAPRVYWEDTKDIQLSFTQGVFTKTQFALMNNLNLLDQTLSDDIRLSKREVVGVENEDDNLIFQPTKIPVGKIFAYDEHTGEKIQFHQDELNFMPSYIIDSGNPINVLLDYEYLYEGNTSTFKVGQTLINGFVSLQGKTRIKLDDAPDHYVTGIINIPKLKLRSGISMRLGADAKPHVGTFNALACPTGGRGSSYVMEFLILEDYE